MAVERIFSQGRQLLSFTRNRLGASSIRASLCMGSWGRNNLLFFEDLLAGVKSSSKRRRELSDVEVIE
jgi:LSD1 subclass zinc finger protein